MTSDWRSQLKEVKRSIRANNTTRITLPSYFNFKDHGAFDFDKALQTFNWELRDCSVEIDFTSCRSANYQALSLVVLYSWHLKSNNCHVEYIGLSNFGQGRSTDVWKRMGAPGLFQVAFNENQNFISHELKPLIAIRNHADFRNAMSKASDFSKDFSIEYINTLRYVISELLYNTIEHGKSYFQDQNSRNKQIPSLIQFTWYQKRNEIHFLIGDLGIGIKHHLSQTYPDIIDDEAALQKAIQPQVSGTFAITDPYKAKNNAGMGLFLSSNIVRKLRADMHLISGNAVLHVSPTDTTTRRLSSKWPGTIALVTLQLEKDAGFDLDKMMASFRDAAEKEQRSKEKAEAENSFYLSIWNYFGTYPEDKSAAIKYRDKYLIAAANGGKRIILDFSNVESSPHSFLSALLATPIKNLGMDAYKRIKIINAKPDIRETIDFILDDSTSGTS
ncbi:STAS-like domain-containing protein [Lysobacter enzymogenes]|uniref:STAS-like domain-containing protein n=1 Tax=Lysobacter enzymogenes TaxID=69 RepID=UPI003850DF15